MKKLFLILIALIIALFALIQLVPYGRDHQNPAVIQEPAWTNPQTRLLAQRACFDCHSNESVWPWYSNIAPVSWLVQRDVDEGRYYLNFSEWGRQQRELDELAEVLYEGEMPPAQYLILHPTARLTANELKTLANGLAALGGSAGSDH